jgi:predicted phage terminase large subunit-like protein
MPAAGRTPGDHLSGIEDSGVGTALIAELRREGLNAKAIKPERDKVSRMSVASARIEAGQVFFPSQAPWLASLEEELLSFPHGRHDDQVDSVSQTLNNPGYSYDRTMNWVG